MFSNMCLLKNNIRQDMELAIFSTGGPANKNLKGDLISYGKVWLHPGGIKNILYFSKVTDKYRVACNSTSETNDWYICQGEWSDPSNIVTGDYSTLTFLMDRGRHS